MPKPTQKLKSCGFLIYRDTAGNPTAPLEDSNPLVSQIQRSFLLMKHSDRWDLPKGHVDDGESNLECALRELEEETGIGERDIEIDHDFRFQLQYKVVYKRFGSDPIKKKLIIFLARLRNEVDINPTEHQGYQWFPWAPPHTIQQETIDPLLEQLAEYWK